MYSEMQILQILESVYMNIFDFILILSDAPQRVRQRGIGFISKHLLQLKFVRFLVTAHCRGYFIFM